MCKKETSKSITAGPPFSNLYFASYPIFALGTDGQGLVITGGGGGGKSYGVLNYLQAHVVIQDPSTRALCVETIATLDTGAGTPIAIDYLKGGLWACSLGNECLLFKFSDDSLSIEPLFRFKTEISGDPLHVTNFVRLSAHNAQLSVLTGGEDRAVRLWRLSQDSGSKKNHPSSTSNGAPGPSSRGHRGRLANRWISIFDLWKRWIGENMEHL